MNSFKCYRTIRKHRKAVRKLCFRCGLYSQGLMHDLSRYSKVEFSNELKYSKGSKPTAYENEREAKGYSEAWLHYKSVNKYCPEYWTECVDGNMVMIRMPRKYLIEYVCDFIATALGDTITYTASEKPWNYFTMNRDKLPMVENTKRWLEYFTGLWKDNPKIALEEMRRFSRR